MGETVQQKRKPFLWLLDQLPFHVTNPSKLKVFCPLKYRQYAKRIDNNVPMFEEEVTLHKFPGAEQVPNIFAPALPFQVGGSSNSASTPSGGNAQAGGDDVDIPLTIPEVLCDEDGGEGADEIMADPSINVRSKSKRALLLEAESLEHLSLIHI